MGHKIFWVRVKSLQFRTKSSRIQILVRIMRLLKRSSHQGDMDKIAHAEKTSLVKFKFSVR